MTFLSVCCVCHSKNAVGSTSSFGRTGSERKCSHTRISHFCFHFLRHPPAPCVPYIPTYVYVHTYIPTLASVDKIQSRDLPSRSHWLLFMAKVFGGVCYCWAPEFNSALNSSCPSCRLFRFVCVWLFLAGNASKIERQIVWLLLLLLLLLWLWL